MKKQHFTTRGWCSPERYIQGPGEFERLPFYTDKFGKKLVFFIDGFFFESFQKKLEGFYADGEHEIQCICFSTEVTASLIDRHAAELAAGPWDAFVGIGGGKTIDVTKAVAIRLGKPFIIVPTAASTDAPTSGLSVIYQEDGSHAGEYFYDHSPSLLLVDSQIIAEAPTRLLVSGMGDALATLIEARACNAAYTPNLVYNNDGGFRHTIAGRAVAQSCYDTLMEYGVEAKRSCDLGIVTPALENVIEANILLSGLGFENNATCGAHSVNDGLTKVPNGNKTMHGEKVAFGCLVQLIAENAPVKELEEVTDFCLSVGLPVCLADLQIDNSDETIRAVAEGSMHSCWDGVPFPVSADTVFAAIKQADAYGAARRQK